MPLSPQWILLMAAVLLLAVYAVVSAARDTRKLRRQQQQNYGRPPAVRVGRLAGERFWQTAAEKDPPPWPVDDLTWNDLDMDEVFGRLNTCQSALGDIRLYMALRSLLPDSGLVARRNALAQRLDDEEGLRRQVGYRLARLGRWTGTGLEWTAYEPQRLALPNAWRFRLCALAPFFSLPLLFWRPALGGLWLVGWLMANFVITAATKTKYGDLFRSVRYVAGALACCRRLARPLEADMPQQAALLRQAAAPFAQWRRTNALLAFSEACERSGWPDPTAFFALPLLSFAKTARRLPGRRQDLLFLFETLGEMDLALCVAGLRRSLPAWCRPVFWPAAALEAQGLYHPLLDTPVLNDLLLERDLLLTGSNASGKSTFIKAAALNCILAQTLDTCTAGRFCMGRGRVATSMAVEDNILAGDSYFVAEIKSMRRLLLRGTQDPAWLFVDEVLKGTNTVERVAAAAAVLRGLQAAQVRWVAATHDIELVRILGDACENAHFTENITEAGVTFDYRLRPGPATSRNALLLLERMDFPAGVVENARRLAAGFEQTGEWARLDAR